MMVMTMMNDKVRRNRIHVPPTSYFLATCTFTSSLQEFYGTVPAAVLL